LALRSVERRVFRVSRSEKDGSGAAEDAALDARSDARAGVPSRGGRHHAARDATERDAATWRAVHAATARIAESARLASKRALDSAGPRGVGEEKKEQSFPRRRRLTHRGNPNFPRASSASLEPARTARHPVETVGLRIANFPSRDSIVWHPVYGFWIEYGFVFQ